MLYIGVIKILTFRLFCLAGSPKLKNRDKNTLRRGKRLGTMQNNIHQVKTKDPLLRSNEKS